MNRPQTRRIQTRFYLFRTKYFQIKKILSFLLLISILVGLIPLIIYFVTYYGYKSKLITDPSKIPEELTTGVIVTDNSDRNLGVLLESAEELYAERTISNLYVFSIDQEETQPKEITNSEIPSARIKVLTAKDLGEVCKSAKEQENLSKFLILSFEDYAIRTSFICNNSNIYSVAYTPEFPIDAELPNDQLIKRITEVVEHTFSQK